MYEAFFGLKGNPFSMTPDPGALFWTSAHREALAGLTYAVTRRKGFVVLTGAAGTGKTTLLRKLLDTSPVNIQASFVYNPTLTPSEFLELALTDFDMPQGPMNKAQRLLKLEQFLLDTHRAGQVAVLIIDEAHKLSPDLLEEVRLLTNFETAKQKLLQIVLAGQPELDGVLNRDDLWQLKQRIAVRLQIRPLTEPEISQYLTVRWTKAGGEEPVPFEKPAVDLIGKWSRGIPRIINGICDNALLMAFSAGRGSVGAGDILEVVHDLDLTTASTGLAARTNGAAPKAVVPNGATNGVAPRRTAAVAPLPQNGVKPQPHPEPAAVSSAIQAPFRTFDQYESNHESFLSRWAEKIGLRNRRPGMAK
jgi:general secretion pathway protein A